MKKYLINYAHKGFSNAQKRNSATGKEIGKFDHVFECCYEFIDPAFRMENHGVLSQEKGAGLWLWKPYFINMFMDSISEGDILFYCDSGSEFIHSVDPLINVMDQHQIDIMLFHTDPVPGNRETMQTKGDCFAMLDCMQEKYYNSTPLHGGFQMYRKSKASEYFTLFYLMACTFPGILSEEDNRYVPNFPDFMAHRHDQSVLSLIAKRWDLKSFRDLTQYGNPYILPGEYPQIINHTRARD
jgi:hypothetical protein